MWGTQQARPSRSGFRSSKDGGSLHVRPTSASTRWCRSSGHQSTVGLERDGTCALSDLHRDDVEGGFERRALDNITLRGLGRIGWGLRPL